MAREVGTEGMLGGQARVPGVAGTWRDLTDSVNSMAEQPDQPGAQHRRPSRPRVARGDLSQKISIEARGEVAALAGTINAMVDTLRAFADEVTRVAREVGTEGILGGQAHVRGVAGTWKDLTDSVNSMAGNLTSQVRSIALVTTAVAHGDLTQKTYVDARGEILELKTTVNRMVDQLSSFADEVTRVAREVGTEGKLGGQAEVADVSGHLAQADRERQPARRHADHPAPRDRRGVDRGDPGRPEPADHASRPQGEVAELKDNLNQMIDNLRETTRANQEQDWLKTNLARFTGHMQGGRDLLDVTQLIVSELTPLVGAQPGLVLPQRDRARRRPVAAPDRVLRLPAAQGRARARSRSARASSGRRRVEPAADPAHRRAARLHPDRLGAGRGARRSSIVILPVVFEEQVLGVVELASFSPFSAVHMQFLEQLMEIIGVSLNAIIASSRTQELLVESQRLAAELQDKSGELQTQQGELQQTNAELEEKARLLAAQNRAIEIKNLEIEDARRGLEDRAEQLALSSRYKSEFLANMSHELRTPLNSLLILAKLLTDNADGNLNPRQVEFAQHHPQRRHRPAPADQRHPRPVQGRGRQDGRAPRRRRGRRDRGVRRGDVPAAHRGEGPAVLGRRSPTTCPARCYSDQHRLQQVLRNLLSNAVKFTSSGEVTLVDPHAPRTSTFTTPALDGAEHGAWPSQVTDTGIGIPPEQLRTIFEAFQQADGTISRKFGGTGLGLSISREIARLIGGEIHVESEPGRGSTFTLYLPRALRRRRAAERLASGADQAAVTPHRGGRRRSSDACTRAVADDEGDIVRGDRVLLVALSDAELCRGRGRGRPRATGSRCWRRRSADDALVVAARSVAPTAMVVGHGHGRRTTARRCSHALKRHPETRHIPTVAVHRPAPPTTPRRAGWPARSTWSRSRSPRRSARRRPRAP